jgi:RNA polymerase sigma-70 factor (ECF subfamily)
MSDHAGGAKDDARRQDPSRAVEAPADDPEVLDAVRRLQAGDEAAAEVLFRRYYPPIRLFFENQSRLKHEADDLAQETLKRAFLSIEQFRFESRFHTWLRRIGKNVWRNADRYHRATKRGAPTVPLDVVTGTAGEENAGVDSGRTELEALSLNPEEATLSGESVQVLQTAMAGLPAGMRHLTELRVLQDLSYDDIAERAGVSTGTVKSQLHEARKRLRPVLRDYFRDAEL